MGNRRIGRKRLYAVEKAGKTIDLESGAGIKNAIKSASQHRNGQELITEIAIDLGVTDIKGGGGNDQAMGETSKKAHITQLTIAKYGIITEIRAILTELVAGGHNAVAVATHATAAGENSGTSVTARIDDINVIGEDNSYLPNTKATLQNVAGSEHCLYLANAGGGNADQMNTGKLLIYIHGFEEPADL